MQAEPLCLQPFIDSARYFSIYFVPGVKRGGPFSLFYSFPENLAASLVPGSVEFLLVGGLQEDFPLPD
jgi:hypothetical protein